MKKNVLIVHSLISTKLMLILFLSIFVSLEASAVPQNISFQSKIYKPDGTPLEAASVQFKFSVMNPISTCIIYAETFSNIDLTGTAGSVVLTLGGPGGVPDYNDGGVITNWYDAFNNATATYNCRTSGTYSPGITDIRRIVMQFHDGTPVGWQTLPPIDINSVPYAMFAQTAETVSSVDPSIITAGGASVGQVLKWSGTNWIASADNSGVTSVAPSIITAGGASVGQVLKWNGSNWVASADNSGASAALTSANIFIGNASNLAEGRVLSGDATIDNAGTLTLSNTSTARSNLGLGGAAVLNVGTGAGTVAAGNDSRFTDSRAPTGGASGDLTGAYPGPSLVAIGAGGTGTKITYDTKGRVTSSTNMNSSDVTTALGYTPTSDALATANIFVGNGSGLAQARVLSGDATIDSSGILTITSIPWAKVTSTPTTLAGYGISDALSTATVFSGDVSGTSANISVNKLKGQLLNITALASGDIVQYNGTEYVNKNIPVCGANQYLTFNGASWSCAADVGAGGIVTSVGGTAPIVSTGGATPVLSMAQASAGADGYLASSDFTLFNNKLTAGLTSANIFVGNGSNLAEGRVLSGDATINSSGVLSLVNSATARSNLGLGTSAVFNVPVAGNAGVGEVVKGDDGRLTDGRAPVGAASGDLSGTYPAPTLAVIGAGGTSSKVTFDTKGRIISSAALVSTDITTALTFTPANGANYVAKVGDSMSGALVIAASSASADLSVTQSGAGPAATFVGGNVGIGTTAPTAKLMLASSDGTASSAPLKLTAGTNLSTPEDGAIEYDGTNLFYTDSGATRRTLATTSVLGASYVAKAGDSMTGPLNISSSSASADFTVTQSGAGPAATFMGGKVGVGIITPESTVSIYGTASDGDFDPTNGLTVYGGAYGNRYSALALSSGGRYTTNSVLGPQFSIVGVNTKYNSTSDTLERNGTDAGRDSSMAISMNSYSSQLGGYRMGFWTGASGNPSERMSITGSGNVGVGTTGPTEKLNVSGNLKVQSGQAYVAPQASSAASPLAFNTDAGNMMTWTTNTVTPTIDINNMKPGGSYVLIIRGTGTGTPVINCWSGVGTGAITTSALPALGARSVTATIYNVMTDGTHCYVTWASGFP